MPDYRVPWWPVHPIGLVAGFSFVTSWLWFGVLVAWLAKTIMLKYGGPNLYRKGRYFFMGLVCGEAFVAGMWIIIDSFTGMTMNVVSTFW